MPTTLKLVSRLAGAHGFFSPVKKPFASRLLSSLAAPYQARIKPVLSRESKVILPISMTRYDGDKEKREQYDKDIDALLRFTAEGLETGRIGRVEVLSTAGLQELNWNKEKAKEIEDYFMSAHHKMLEKQNEVHTWDGFISKVGKEKFESNYQLIKTASIEGSVWHGMMLKTHKAIKINSDIEKSLECQRRKYAAILSMKGMYTNVVCMGNMSLAWSYLYQEYQDLPVFNRVILEKIKKKVGISTVEADAIVSMISRNIEDVLTNENFPKKVKRKLAERGTSLFQAYVPRSDQNDDVSDTEDKKSGGLVSKM
jgi:hypothetical protein